MENQRDCVMQDLEGLGEVENERERQRREETVGGVCSVRSGRGSEK